MTSIGAVTRQIATLEVSSKPNTQQSSRATGATHQKKPSQNGGNVTKLLSKFAAPNPFPSGHAKTASTATTTSTTITAKSRPPSPSKPAPSKLAAPKQHVIDIGRYDGGLEIDNESRGEKVTGEAAEDLALDSSVARCVVRQLLHISH